MVGPALRDRLAPEGAWAAVGALAIATGSLLWIVGNIIDLGGAKAVKELSGGGDGPIEPVNAINFTTDMIDDAFETFGSPSSASAPRASVGGDAQRPSAAGGRGSPR